MTALIKRIFARRNRFLLIMYLVSALILFLSLRGLPGNPAPRQLNTSAWKENGPFELSPERGRYALLYAVAQFRSLHFPPSLALFTLPDVGYLNGQYVSLFDPGISFLALPGYFLGRALGAAQVGTFAVVALFALANLALIQLIAMKLGVNKYLAALSGFLFLFATPAFTYAVTFYQHHFSVFFILLATYLLLRSDSFFTYAAVAFLASLSFLVDYPNLILMFPFLLHIAVRTGERLAPSGARLRSVFKIALVLAAAAVPLLILGLFNKISYGNPWQLAGTVKTVKDMKIEAQGPRFQDKNLLVTQRDLALIREKKQVYRKDAVSLFREDYLFHGLYILLLSPDRGMVFYAPVLILGFLGMIAAFRRRAPLTDIAAMLVGVNIFFYAVWSDPWGGWAFGGRYLIPAYAVLAVYAGFFLSGARRHLLVWLIFIPLFFYGIAVNAMGAVTSSMNPPQVEAVALEKTTHMKEAYTWERNIGYLEAGRLKSFVFQAFARGRINGWQYYLLLLSAVSLGGLALSVRYHMHLAGRRKFFTWLALSARGALGSIRDDIRLFLQTPKEYLYLYTFPADQKVVLEPWDPQVRRLGQKLLKQIRRKYPRLVVHFIGSAMLGIEGQRDIDLYARCRPEDFYKYLSGLVALFGEPVKIRPRFVEWHAQKRGINIDLLLVDPTIDMYYKPLKTFKTIRSNRKFIEEYRRIKRTLNGVGVREYQKRRLMFFNRILGL